MRTLPFTPGTAPGSRRRRAAVVSGVVTLAASTTLPFVRHWEGAATRQALRFPRSRRRRISQTCRL